MKQVEELLADHLKTDTVLTHSMKRPAERAKKKYNKVQWVHHSSFKDQKLKHVTSLSSAKW